MKIVFRTRFHGEIRGQSTNRVWENRVLNTIFTTGADRTGACSEIRVLEHDFHYGRRQGEHGFKWPNPPKKWSKF